MAHLASTNLEYVLTHSQKDDWMIYIASQEEDFPELIHLSIADKQPIRGEPLGYYQVVWKTMTKE